MFYASLGLALAALPAALAATYDVTVGAGGLLRYNPEFVTANPGDVVNFIL
jgi:plastocyanin